MAILEIVVVVDFPYRCLFRIAAPVGQQSAGMLAAVFVV
jgi:hypothetical protein